MMQKILKGDTSGQVSLALADGFDYTDATVEVIYQGAVRQFKNCAAGQTIQFAFTAAETAPMALGVFPVTVRIGKPDGTLITVANAGVKIAVTDCIGEVRAGSVIAVDAHGGLYGVDDLPANYTIKDLRAKINEIITKLGGGVAALCLLACTAFGAGVNVQKAALEDIPNGAQVVTNATVDFTGLATVTQLNDASNNVLTASKNYTDTAVQQAGGMTPAMTRQIVQESVGSTSAVYQVAMCYDPAWLTYNTDWYLDGDTTKWRLYDISSSGSVTWIKNGTVMNPDYTYLQYQPNYERWRLSIQNINYYKSGAITDSVINFNSALKMVRKLSNVMAANGSNSQKQLLSNGGYSIGIPGAGSSGPYSNYKFYAKYGNIELLKEGELYVRSSVKALDFDSFEKAYGLLVSNKAEVASVTALSNRVDSLVSGGFGFPNHGLVLTNGVVKTKGGTSVTPSDIGAKPFFNVGNGLTETPADSLYAWRWYYYNQSFDEYYTKSPTPSAGSRLYNSDGSYRGQEWFVVTAYNSANNTISIQDYASTIVAQRWASDDIPANPVISVVDGFGMPNNGLVLTNNAVKTKSGTAITAAQVGAASSAELSTVSGNANQALLYSSGIYQYMVGNTNAWLEGTNYVTTADAANRTRFAWEQGMDAGTVPCSMALREIRDGNRNVVWDQRDWTVWYWNFKSAQLSNNLAAVTHVVSEEVRTNCMKRGFAKYTAVQGLDNPATDTLWIDTPKVQLMAGHQWEKLITVGGAGYYTLTGNGIELSAADTTNTFLTIKDFEGNACLTFRKTSSYLVYCECGTDITGNYHDNQGRVVFHFTTDVQPTGEFSTTLDLDDFVGQGEDGCPANYEWTGSAGSWDCHFKLKDGIVSTSCFARFKIQREGENVVEHTVPIKLDGGIVFTQNGTQYKIKPSISGGNVVWSIVQ